MGAERGFADVNGARLYYEVAGEGAAVVLLHAGIADSRMWDDQMPVLAERHRVIRYDLRGCGRSQMPAAPYSHSADLHGLLRCLGLERASLVGASLGGATALDFALEHPEMVTALILAAPGLGGYSFSEATTRRFDEIDAALEQEGVDRANELELCLWVDGPNRTPDQVEPSVRERVRAMNAAAFAPTSDEAVRQRPSPPALGRLAEIKAPTLIVVGAGDVPDMLTIAYLLAGGVAGARQVVLPNVAHMLAMEEPATLNRLVLDFLAEQQSEPLSTDARSGGASALESKT
jgi:pimeloyl-ACP methyl ester carboxylesterase